MFDPPDDGDRDGDTFDHGFDYDRLNKQARSVFDVVRDGNWHTLADIAERTGNPEASVSARLRDLRKAQFGSWTVERRRDDFASSGLFWYRLVAVRAADLFS